MTADNNNDKKVNPRVDRVESQGKLDRAHTHGRLGLRATMIR